MGCLDVAPNPPIHGCYTTLCGYAEPTITAQQSSNLSSRQSSGLLQ
ncbi:MAG: hypothetical protein FWF25_06390 [Propionibacteriaceae bacterium]|nr:hypothetical protein [Propionibacteriaceae bacterium]